MADTRTEAEIVGDFNQTIKTLISTIEKKSRSELELSNLDLLKKRISLLRNTMGSSALISTASPIIIDYSEQINNRDEEFFTRVDVRAEYLKAAGKINSSDEFIFGLTDSVRSLYNKSSQAQKDYLYTQVKKLLICSIEYNLLD